MIKLSINLRKAFNHLESMGGIKVLTKGIGLTGINESDIRYVWDVRELIQCITRDVIEIATPGVWEQLKYGEASNRLSSFERGISGLRFQYYRLHKEILTKIRIEERNENTPAVEVVVRFNLDESSFTIWFPPGFIDIPGNPVISVVDSTLDNEGTDLPTFKRPKHLSKYAGYTFKIEYDLTGLKSLILQQELNRDEFGFGGFI